MKGGGLNVVNLTPKQKAFADEYIKNGGNATQAAIKAGYSKRSARVIGKENLTKPNIIQYINERLNPIEKKRKLSAEDALNELIDILARRSTNKREQANRPFGEKQGY